MTIQPTVWLEVSTVYCSEVRPQKRFLPLSQYITIYCYEPWELWTSACTSIPLSLPIVKGKVLPISGHEGPEGE